MSSNLAKALLILNAKKGWSDLARKKAAMTRKAKSKVEGKPRKIAGRLVQPKELKAMAKMDEAHQTFLKKIRKKTGSNGATPMSKMLAKAGVDVGARKKVGMKSGETKAKKKNTSVPSDKPDYAKAVASAKGGGLYDSWKHTKIGKHKVKFAKIGDRYDAQSSSGMRVSGKTPEEALSKLILRPTRGQ